MNGETVTDLTKGVYRRLYSGFTKGQRINKLSIQAEAWFWRVLATVDDFGNGDADPELCRDATVGRRRGITAKQISGWLREMREAGLISFYTVKGEPFLHVVGFEESQPAGKNGRRIRRFEPPSESGLIQENPDVVSASYSDNDNYAEDDTDTKKAQAPDSPPFASDEFLNALSDFEQHRKEIRHKLTPKARQAMYADFVKWGELKSIEAIRLAIRNGWRGVFEPKENGNGTSQFGNYQTAPERRDAELRRRLQSVADLQGRGNGTVN